jgi:glucokinase
MQSTIGVDLGGSHVMAAAIDSDGTIVRRAEHDIADRTFEVVLKKVGDTIAEVIAGGKKSEATAIGIGAPGNIELATGKITYSPNFGWTNAPLGAGLRDRFDLPVFVANDARCATLGEYTFGVGKGTKNFVLLTLGTGIGGGIVLSGTLAIGNSAGAGEIGHHQIRATDGFVCNCGKTGCFEAQASGTGLLRHALALAPSFPRSELLGTVPGKVGSKAIRRAAEAGDPHASAAWKRFVDDLSIGVANVIAFANPETIALGGGVPSAGEFLLAPLRLKVDELTTMVPRGQTKILVAQLGNDAGAIGAALVAANGGLEGSAKELR